jgi:hypothetical protein
MSTFTWFDRITVLSVHPDAATRDDISRLASDLMRCRNELARLLDVVADQDVESITDVLAMSEPDELYGAVEKSKK